MSVLEVDGVSIRFGGLQALSGISLTVNEWEIVGLIGPNGAGKTTAFNCITGFYKADQGTVTYRGRDVTRVPPHEKAAMGFGRTFQNVGLVKSATVLENLKTAQHARIDYDVLSGLVGTARARLTERELARKADAVLELLGLGDYRSLRVGGLSYGTLKLLELGCALATDPDVLLLDEPSSGMGPEEAHDLGGRLLDLRREFGLTMLLIEHHVPLVLEVCDHIYVLNFGRLLAEGEPTVIQTHPEVVAAYLGGEAADELAATTEPEEDAALDREIEEAAHEGAGGHEGARGRGGQNGPGLQEMPMEVTPRPGPRRRVPAAPGKPSDSTVTAELLPIEEPPPEEPPARPRRARAAAERTAATRAAATRSPRPGGDA